MVILFIVCSCPLAAAPTGQQLLEVCEQAIANDFKDRAGQMCIWYVTPCDCVAGKPEHFPRVCLPGNLPSETLAQKVITGLKAEPDLTNKSADLVAAVILSRSYPCPD